MNHKVFENKVRIAPQEPGCYIWKDKAGKVLYIGKAVNLRHRSGSYFTNYSRLDPKIRNMVDLVADVEYYTVDSEAEALILETNLIKKYHPKYNKLMKDDKNYSWVEINWKDDLPEIKVVREQKNPKNEYYGPYPARFPVFKVLRRLRKVFPYCDRLPHGIKYNSETKKIEGVDEKPCFDFHIGLCSGICAGIVSKNEHRKSINGIRKFFKGEKGMMVDELKSEMAKKSKEMDFEQASELRDRIRDLEYVTQQIRIEADMDEVKLEQMKKDLRSRALDDLIDRLGIEELKVKPEFKIECYDISNIQGTNAVGSMVVSLDGKAVKNLYRKFKIKTKSTPDDFAMMREVLIRRLKRLKKTDEEDLSFKIAPDLIIVDGGKGQLSAAYGILEEMELTNIPIVGLAKREEEIFKINLESIDKFELIRLNKRSEALYLVQRIRDEAHRFGIGYHRLLRSKGSVKSLLDDIPGIGEVTKKRLFEAFGSVNSIQKAKVEDIAAVVKNRSTLNAIIKILHPKEKSEKLT